MRYPIIFSKSLRIGFALPINRTLGNVYLPAFYKKVSNTTIILKLKNQISLEKRRFYAMTQKKENSYFSFNGMRNEI